MKTSTFAAILVIVSASLVAAEELPAPSDVAAPPENAECTDSGLCTRVLSKGTGTEHPDAWDKVTVHYSGWTTDGKLFDSSVQRGKPASFPLNRVIPGWTEGLQLMVVGEKRRLWIPVELAYNNRPGRPAGMLVFDVELLAVEDQPKPPDPPPVPDNVSGPPDDAEVTKSGLASKVLQPGTGTDHPKRSSRVTVHYTGWTTDGEMFDSSVVRGKPATFPLNQVIPGWTEGVQLMVVGEKRRFWIPEKLAYKGASGAPQGMLVFDVELISFD
jgi:peptidylprolyl isomerase